jgi:hypothetical protein
MTRILAATLAALLTSPAWSGPQQTPPATPPQEPPATAVPATQQPQRPASLPAQPAMIPGSLKILVLEGQGAVNNVGRGLITPPVIEVRDRDDRPVEGATVTFRLPPSGASGNFADGKLTKTVLTNVQGQAIAAGLAPNKSLGRLDIHVTASAGSRMGEADVIQTNTADRFAAAPETAAHKVKWKKWAIIGGVGVAAIVAVVLATRGGSSSSPNHTVTITPGPVTIGQ